MTVYRLSPYGLSLLDDPTILAAVAELAKRASDDHPTGYTSAREYETRTPHPWYL